MRSKVDRAKYGPGPVEVLLGALLSLLLGVVLAAVYLVLKPVDKAAQLPKDPAPGQVYYLEGSDDSVRGQQWLRKRQLFLEGSSVSLNEDELNTWIASANPAAAKAGAAAAAASGSAFIAAKTPNFRIRQGVFQVALPFTLNAFGLSFPLIAQATGNFVKDGDEFVFHPARFYLGSCPLQSVPGAGLVFRHLAGLTEVPPDVAEAWKKLADVGIEGGQLHLTMP